jgi:glucosamine-6-phosphate deaminase
MTRANTAPLPVVVTSAVEGSRAVAAEIAELIRERRRAGRAVVLGLATGRTPLGVYDELARMHAEDGLDFSNVTTFNLDEFLDLAPDHAQCFRRYMRERFFERVGIDTARAWLPHSDVTTDQIDAHCSDYELRIARAGGIDIQVLGIGRNGHIGFNEPGSRRESRTRAVELDLFTREDAAAQFGGLGRVPRRAITMGIATILEARRVRVLAFGAGKRDVVRRALEEPIGPAMPATFLRGHADVRLYVDRAAHPEAKSTGVQ